MNVRFYSPLKSIFGIATQWTFAAFAPLGTFATVAACSSPVVLPAPLGDCTGTRDASCASSSYGGGTSTSLPSEAGTTSEDDTGVASSVDAGSCGLGTLPINPANSLCLPCISTASTLGCCMAAQACSNDPICLGALTTFTVGQDITTVQFVQCLEMNCPAVCSDIVFKLSNDQ
jgi:hypothetical protein